MPWRDNTQFTALINTFTNDYNQRKRRAATSLEGGDSTSRKIQEVVMSAENLLVDNMVKFARNGSEEYRFGPQPDWIEEHYLWVNQELDALNELRQRCGLAKVDRKITREGNNQQEEREANAQARAEQERKEQQEKQRKEQYSKSWQESFSGFGSGRTNEDYFSPQQEALYEQHLERGMAAAWNAQHSHAVLNFDNALKIKPNSLNARIRRGVELEYIPGRIREGRAELAEARRQTPRSADDYVGLAGLAFHIDKSDSQALGYLRQALQQDSDHARAYLLRGGIAANKGEYDKALADYNKALEINPDSALAYYKGGEARSAKGQYDHAIQDYDKAIEINPNFALAYYGRGVAWGNKGQHDNAIQDYNKAIEINPSYADAYNNRGVAWGNKGQYDHAIQDYTKAIEINPSYADAYYGRGWAWDNKGQYDYAIQDYNKAIEINPSDALAYYNRGVAWGNKGQHDYAIQDYTKAIEINPSYANAYNGRGWAWEQKGQYKRARADYVQALRIDPSHTLAGSNLQTLEARLQPAPSPQVQMAYYAPRFYPFDVVAETIKAVTGIKRTPTISLTGGVDQNLHNALHARNLGVQQVTQDVIHDTLNRLTKGYRFTEVMRRLDSGGMVYGR